MKVVIGPSIELHTGIHGSLLSDPPDDIHYSTLPSEYVFLYQTDDATRNFDPFEKLSVSESVRYCTEQEKNDYVFHSSRMPVYNDAPWIVDADCLLATLSAGQFYAIGSWARKESIDVNMDLQRLRQQSMLQHYLDSRCGSILLRTHYAKRQLIEFATSSGLLPLRGVDLLEEKIDVIYPTIRFSKNNASNEIVQVVYSGRTLQDKGYDIALAVFGRLKKQYGAICKLICVSPRRIGLSAIPGLLHLPILPRDEYIALLRNSHIFFSPTYYESFGMALVEAAACGMAIVTGKGVGMEHLAELFAEESNCLFVPNCLDLNKKVDEYVACISRLVDNRTLLRNMQDNNEKLVTLGPLSLQNRNNRLRYHYEKLANISRSEWWKSTVNDRIKLAHNLGQRIFSETYLSFRARAFTNDKYTRITI